jgi:magnesium transporter
MKELYSGMSKKAGLPPGTIAPVGEKGTGSVRIRVIDYDEKDVREREVEKVEDCFSYKDSESVTWINIDGLHDTERLQAVGAHFEMHPLTLEDIASVGQRAKLEDGEGYLFVLLRMLSYDSGRGGIESEQVSIVLREGCVISFQERAGDVFEGIRERIRTGKGRIRGMGADYLAYGLLDAIVDQYFVILEQIGEKLESVEDGLLDDPSADTLQAIHSLKRDTIFLRRSIWPTREVSAALSRTESPLIKESTVAYLRDLYDHTVQVVETVETFRDMVSGVRDTYLSSVSNRMNEVMKVLTIIATIFIPITFIAGIYGMNFQKMPELAWRYGYAGALGLMGLVALGMLVYFRRKGWL